ncbi:MAG: hypothetical protein J2P29_12240, partial [Actinobacteria bacterium]|nr:hypothetical protein [Actinomycetota bacterium]
MRGEGLRETAALVGAGTTGTTGAGAGAGLTPTMGCAGAGEPGWLGVFPACPEPWLGADEA